MKKLLWSWKALPVTTRRKRFADTVWFIFYGDEADADAENLRSPRSALNSK